MLDLNFLKTEEENKNINLSIEVLTNINKICNLNINTQNFLEDYKDRKQEILTRITLNIFNRENKDIIQIGTLNSIYFEPIRNYKNLNLTSSLISLASNTGLKEVIEFVGCSTEKFTDKFSEQLCSTDEGLLFITDFKINKEYQSLEIENYILKNLRLILNYSLNITVYTIVLYTNEILDLNKLKKLNYKQFKNTKYIFNYKFLERKL